MQKGIISCEIIENEIRNPRLYKYNPWLFRYYKAFDIVNRFLDSLGTGEQAAIWGAGKHTMMLWHGISSENKEKIGYIIEKNPQKHVGRYGERILFVYPEEVDNLPISKIIISSYIFKKDILKEIDQLNRNYTVQSIYAELEDSDNANDLLMDVGADFFYRVEYSYNAISEDLIDLQNCKTINHTKIILKKLIGEYLHIKDFCSAYEYMDKLCSMEDEESGYYLSLKNKLLDEFRHINEQISGKQHIVVNWIDQLVLDDLSNMDFLCDLAQKGISFENAYTQTPYTSPTMATIFSGGLYIDDLLYKMSVNDFMESKLYITIKKYGYSFKYFGWKFADGIFANPNTVIYNNFIYNMQTPSMVYQWEALKELELNDGKCFVIIHNLYETHTPCLNGIQADLGYWIDKDWIRPDEGIAAVKRKKRKEQIILSEKYFDNQLQFYINAYRDIRANVLMSDHGRYSEKNFGEYRYTRNTHVFFAVVGKGMQPRKIKDIFSLRKFPWIMQCIFENESHLFENYTEEYALIQAEDVYHYQTVFCFYQNPDAARKEYVQYRGVITLKDIYVHSILGDEYYYLQGDETKNLIHEEKYQARINELRKIAGNKYINIYKETKYIATREIYKLFDYKISEDIEYLN